MNHSDSEDKEKSWKNLEIFKNKGIIKITKDHFEILRKGKYLESTKNQQITPKEANLMINQLPPEILIMICEFLSPAAFCRLGMTCKDFQDIFNDQETWRKIAKFHQEFFTFDYFELNFNNFDKHYNIFAFQTPIIQEIEEIQIQNQNLDFPNLSQIHFQELNQKRENKLKEYFNNSKFDDSTMLAETSNARIPVLISTEEERMKYINLLENPKEEMLEKGRKIYNILLEEKNKLKKKMEKKKKREKLEEFEKKEADIFSPLFLSLISIGFSIYLILLTLKIERKIATKLTYLSIPILIPTFGVLVVFVADLIFRIWSKEYHYNLGHSLENALTDVFLFMHFFQFLLIGLRVDNFIKCSWIAVFIPYILIFFIFAAFFFYLQFFQKSILDCEFICFVIFFLLFILFFVILGLKLDGKIKWNYSIIFIPLFLQVFFYFLSFIIIHFWQKKINEIILAFCVVPSIWITFLLLMMFYLDNKGIHHLYYPLIPVYLILLLLDIGSFFVLMSLIRPLLPKKTNSKRTFFLQLKIKNQFENQKNLVFSF
ncbi:fam11a b protein [Anaeramoeba ignava]|uniref:Fam11a b protein n=1 Tax=Anaeramoeba ignava TaxID=1746090 RepID=A0A9Q0R961_ANAIG|nr:fam11a b protein [Anaeramoeba ignava]